MNPRTTGDKITDVAFDADVEYYVLNGSSVVNVVCSNFRGG